MTRKTTTVCALAMAGACCVPALAHVTLEQPRATAGTSYKAVFRVGHGCAGGLATTGIAVRLPTGFGKAQPMPKPGWTVEAVRSASDTQTDPVEVRWTAEPASGGLPHSHYDEFVLRGALPPVVGPLWFRVLQSCPGDVRSDWAEIPASGTDLRGLKSPAALLNVVAPTGDAAAPRSGDAVVPPPGGALPGSASPPAHRH